MKYILIVILLISSKINGQITAGRGLIIKDGEWADTIMVDTSFRYIMYFPGDTEYEDTTINYFNTLDTIPVIMLISDSLTRAISGYEVKYRFQNCMGDCPPYYLDADKQRLLKSIIVWQTRLR